MVILVRIGLELMLASVITCSRLLLLNAHLLLERISAFIRIEAPSVASAHGDGSPADTGELSTCIQQSEKFEFRVKLATNP